MAIARVRIAPVEQWCEAAKNVPHNWKPGMTITIDTSSMVRKKLKSHPEEANFWRGYPDDGNLICEHMLEMD